MATTDAAVVDAPPAQKRDREHRSPPPAQPSKRDKRRQMLVDRITALEEKIGQGSRDQAFREQLQRIQIDTSLVMRVDPYADRPLEGFEEDEQKMLQLQNNGEEPHEGPRSLLEMAGPRFQDWIQDIQDLIEGRDFTLAKYKFDFEKKCSEYRNTQAYKFETANREHRALSGSLRDRLINVITAKKYRLNKEKEALEISDASALLLHPNQFSINNPSSPGGTHGKRATRQRREIDDMPGGDNRKRKRNGADDDGSPAPQRRAIENFGTTPLWQTDRLATRKATGPVYSIDKLFTDKELAMTYNSSALGAHKFLLTHKPRIDENGHILSSPEDSDYGTGEHDEEASDSIPSAPMMERNVSHATRSARGGNNHPNFLDNKLIGLEALANFDWPGNLERMIPHEPRLPPAFPSAYVRGHSKQGEWNTPSTLSPDDVNGDLVVMQALKQYDEQHGLGSNFSTENGSRKVLEAVSIPSRDQKYVAYVKAARPHENEVRKRLGLDPIEQLEPPNGPEGHGTPSKTGRSGTPANPSPAKGGGLVGVPNLGGVSMSRQSSAGGAPMSRSSSRQKGRARGG